MADIAYLDRNERTFRCSQCPKAFNRRDLLLRHQAAHTKNEQDGKSGPNRSSERAIVACNSCVLSKIKCDNGRPCQKCKKRNIECVTKSITPTAEDQSDTSVNGLPTPVELSKQLNLKAPQDQVENPEQVGVPDESNADSANITLEPCPPGLSNEALLANLDPAAYSNSIPFNSFFESIMEADFNTLSGTLQPPPNVAAYFPEQDWSGDSDIFNLTFTPTLNQILTEDVWSSTMIGEQATPSDAGSGSTGRRGGVHTRHEIFQRSPWYADTGP